MLIARSGNSRGSTITGASAAAWKRTPARISVLRLRPKPAIHAETSCTSEPTQLGKVERMATSAALACRNTA
jgi:hypothetical protein